MLKNNFDPTNAYRAITYLRMSTEMQNKRSPEQQSDEIQRKLESNRLTWNVFLSYRDEGISGRILRNRRGYQQMMNDIKSGRIKTDLILVDTIERFGRVDELQTIRKELYELYGVLVLTADSNFADPNTSAGRALGMVESMRATEHGRVLAHNVNRGKRDAAKQKHWPGGPAPFGYRLHSIMKTEKGREVVDYCVLERDTDTDWIAKAIHEKAAETSWGGIRLAKHFNADPEIPAHVKPLIPESITYMLDNPIYVGDLRYDQNSTGIVADMRVVQRNPEEDVLLVPDFCEPIIDRALKELVLALRTMRREQCLKNRMANRANDVKQLQPIAPGVSVKYLLSGLVFCDECGLRMTASSSSSYVNKSGAERKYVSYVCHGYTNGSCRNATRFPEQWLREKVVGLIRQLIFV